MGVAAGWLHHLECCLHPRHKHSPTRTSQTNMEDEEGDGSLNSVFKSISLASLHLPPCGAVIAINSATTVADAIAMLAKHRIIAAPCIDATAAEGAHWTKKYLGTVSYTALVHWMIDRAGDDTPHTLEQLMATEDLLTSRTIGEVAMGDPERRWFAPFCALEHGTGTLYDAMVLLGKHRAHQVCVVDSETGDLVNIVTQGRVVEFLHDNIGLLGDFPEKTIGAVGLGKPKDVISISWRKNLWDALRLLRFTVRVW
jgi:CBS domain-containing protein